MNLVDNLVPIIVIVIICIQITFFVSNVKRMYVFGSIFSNVSSWKVIKDSNTDFVNGIQGKGNDIFRSICNSINKYLGNNTGSIIDFQLLKDAVDRHCDSVEEDISSQTPVPLYCGLAGTMIGVIVGLASLLSTGSIDSLIGGTDPTTAGAAMQDAAKGINELLKGVAWAMVASIFGITLTTANSLMFKGCKLNEDKGKNDFLAWMQAVLLPALPNDTSSAMNNLVKNLNRFNSTFASNTSELRNALRDVNQSYSIQADIVKAVQEMDVMKMARANVNVLKELQDCTDKLEQFNEYLNSIKGYTDSIQKFNEQFNEEAERLHVMEEIRDFFERNKAEIAKTVADEDNTLREALGALKETSSKVSDELQISLTSQSDRFIELNKQMCDEYTDRLKQLPKLETQLEEIAKIPQLLQNLLQHIERSNDSLVDKIGKTLRTFSRTENDNGASNIKVKVLPLWMKLLISLCTFITTIGVGGMAYMIYEKEYGSQTPQAAEGFFPDTDYRTHIEDTTSLQSDNITNLP
ncbi:MAG: hypothetical protein IJ841_09040 [Prevotella sp.]|nr:hypothetical protein [Prevotella sp.]